MSFSWGTSPTTGCLTGNDIRKKAEEITNDELIERGEMLTFDDAINIQYTSGTPGSQKGSSLPIMVSSITGI